MAVTDDDSVIKGTYDGYGRINGVNLWDPPRTVDLYHRRCWDKDPVTTHQGGSAKANDQGYFFDKSDYPDFRKRYKPPTDSIEKSSFEPESEDKLPYAIQVEIYRTESKRAKIWVAVEGDFTDEAVRQAASEQVADEDFGPVESAHEEYEYDLSKASE